MVPCNQGYGLYFSAAHQIQLVGCRGPEVHID